MELGLIMKWGRSHKQVTACQVQNSALLTPHISAQKATKVLASNGIIHILTNAERLPTYVDEGGGEDLSFIKRYASPWLQ